MRLLIFFFLENMFGNAHHGHMAFCVLFDKFLHGENFMSLQAF